MRAAVSSAPPPAEWSTLLADAVSKPGVIHDAYSRFWNYSVGNQLLAWFQCLSRKLTPGPLNTFLGWLELKRHVRKGEKALTLCMPVMYKRRKAQAQEPASGDEPEDAKGESYTRFIYRPHWFVLAQTEGAEYVPAELPEWSETLALAMLGIERIPFDYPSGNCQGYALERKVSVSPIAFAPHRTLFHELAHVILGHTAELGQMADHDQTPRNLREVEAECVESGMCVYPECRCTYALGFAKKSHVTIRGDGQMIYTAPKIRPFVDPAYAARK